LFFAENGTAENDKKCSEAREDLFLETQEQYEWYPSEPIPQNVSNPQSIDFENDCKYDSRVSSSTSLQKFVPLRIKSCRSISINQVQSQHQDNWNNTDVAIYLKNRQRKCLSLSKKLDLNGKVINNKIKICSVCKGIYKDQYARHVRSMHPDCEEMIEVKTLDNVLQNKDYNLDNKQKKILENRIGFIFQKSKNVGNKIHNDYVLEHRKGLLIPCRLPKIAKSEDLYIMCELCSSVITRREFKRHFSKCKVKADFCLASFLKNVNKSVIIDIPRMHSLRTQLLLSTLSTSDTEILNIVVGKMKNETIKQVILQDPYIIQYVVDSFEAKGEIEKSIQLMRTKSSIIARFSILMQKLDPEKYLSYEDMLTVRNFKAIISIIQELGEYDSSCRLYQKIQIIKDICPLLIEMTDNAKTEAIINEDKKRIVELRNLKELFQSKRFRSVTTTKISTQLIVTPGKKTKAPKDSDIQKLVEYYKEKVKVLINILATAELTPKQFTDAYKELAKTTCAQTLFFNAKRQHEVAHAKVKEYKSRNENPDEAEQELIENLKLEDKALTKSISIFKTLGKNNKDVYVLLTKDLKYQFDLILKYREKAGVNSNNKFMFANTTGLSFLDPYNFQALSAVSCGADNPSTLTSRGFRIDLATCTRVLSLSDEDMRSLQVFMSHSDYVHNKYYRRPIDSMMQCGIAKILVARGTGTLGKFKGKNLQSMNVSSELYNFNTLQSENNSNVYDEEEYRNTFNEENENTLVTTAFDVETTTKNTNRDIQVDDNVTEDFESEELEEDDQKVIKKRQQWTDHEINALRKHFKLQIEAKKLPQRKVIQQAINSLLVLKNRSPAAVNYRLKKLFT
jgi:hypothetical protein